MPERRILQQLQRFVREPTPRTASQNGCFGAENIIALHTCRAREQPRV
jgi:hypothetical protein